MCAMKVLVSFNIQILRWIASWTFLGFETILKRIEKLVCIQKEQCNEIKDRAEMIENHKLSSESKHMKSKLNQ